MNQNNSTARRQPQTTSPSALDPKTRAAGARIVTIVPSRVPAWTSVGFVVDDGPGDVVRAVVDLDGRIEFSYWDPQDGEWEANTSRDSEWAPVIINDRAAASPAVRALLDHVESLRPEEIRATARALVESRYIEQKGHLDAYRREADNIGIAVDLLERRLAVLDIADPTERAVALRIADGWTQTPRELVAVAAEVAAHPDES